MADINWADFKPAPDQDVSALVGTITRVESGGDAGAVSSQGATGSMQIMPATFQQYALPGQDDYANDAHRRAAAVRKIVDDYVHFGGDLAKTAASYIGGRGAVRADGTIRDDVADANGTTPAAYAQRVLGRMKATPKVDWSQFTPVPDTGAGRGAINPPVVDPNAPEPTAPVGTTYQPPEANTDPETATGGPEILQALQANPDAGAGRGSVNPPDAVQQRDVGALESFGRGWGRAGAESAKSIALAPAVLGVAVDAVTNAITGGNSTMAQDAMFRQLVDPAQRAIDWYALAPDEKQGTLAKIADGLGAMAQDLPAMFASGGMSKAPELVEAAPAARRFLELALSRGYDAMRPIMVKAGTERSQQVLDQGGSILQAVIAGTSEALATGMQGAQPMSAEGSLARRVLTGLPVGAAQTEAARVISNASLPDNMQAPFSPENLAVGAITNAAAAGAMGHAGPGHVPDRIDLGYDPTTGKTPVAQAVQAMGERPSSLEPGRAQPVHDPLEEVMNAPTVEAAAAAAAKLASAPSGPDVATIMRGIRPPNPVDLQGSPDERQPAEIPPAVAGADGVGGADAAAGVGPGPGADDLQRAAVEPGGQEGQAAAGAAPVADAGGAAAVEGSRYAFERTPSGSLIVRGDKEGIREALANLPPDVVVPTKDGIQVAKNWSDKAATLLNEFDPTAYQDLNGKKVSIQVEAEDGTRATLKVDAGRALRSSDARERELQRLRACVEAA